MNVIIPMAGAGSRFAREGYTLPKPLIPVEGKPMIVRAIESLNIKAKYYFVAREGEHLQQLYQSVNSVCFEPGFIAIPEVTAGAAVTALLFKDYINTQEELIIANCDQVMDWDSDAALLAMRQYDGAVVTIHSQDPKHSYVRLNQDDTASEFVEKVVVSDHALTGIHYWRHGSDFVASATQMIEDNATSANGEFYVAPTYNYMIKNNKRIGVHEIKENEIHFVGTPADLETYLASR
jgi:dTDP-glucose pyrophosphorylase